MNGAVGINSNADWYYDLQASIESRMVGVTERYLSFIRNVPEKRYGESTKYDYLVEFFADEILGPYDQDISLLLVGNKGRGKSLAAQSISYFTACEIADRNGGKWTDYYNPETNLAVILESEANSVMAIQEKYQVKNYDDIGIGWGARNWQDADNKNKNDVFQINRTDSTLQIFSVPNQFLLDKVPRSLVSHYGEMAQQFFAHGFTTIKMFEPETLFREGKIIQPYLNVDRTKYVLFRIPKPPDDLIKYYKDRRSRNKTLATKKRMDGEDYPSEIAAKEKANAERIATKKGVRQNGAAQAMEADMMIYSDKVMEVIKNGGTDTDLIDMLKEEGFGSQKAKRWVKHPIFKQMFPK